MVAEARPLIAICFGAQVLSHALGGTVTRIADPEIGWFELDVTAPDVPAGGPWLEWHDDAFTVPEGFDELARTDAGPQLIRGRPARGRSSTRRPPRRWSPGGWASGGAEQVRARGGDPDELLAATPQAPTPPRLHTLASDLVDWFLRERALTTLTVHRSQVGLLANLGSVPARWPPSCGTI